MLQSFIVRRNFNKLTVRIYVDCDAREAHVSITYDRRLIRNEAVRYSGFCNPEMCEAWFGQPVQMADGQLSMLEALEWQCRKGILAVDVTA